MELEEMISYLRNQGFTVIPPPGYDSKTLHKVEIVNALKADSKRDIYLGQDRLYHVSYSQDIGKHCIQPALCQDMIETGILVKKYPESKASSYILTPNAYDKST